MNTKVSLAVAAAAVIAISSNAFAGELYGSVERSLNASTPVALTTAPIESGVSSNGEIYAAVDAALDNAKGSFAPKSAPITSLAVGGELGSPEGNSFYGDTVRDESFFAE